MYDEIKLKSLSLYVMAYLIGCFYPAGAHAGMIAIKIFKRKDTRL